MAARDATLPDLQLHDIFHDMSPSPTPLQPDLVQPIPRSASPEMLTEADIAEMRHRVVEIDSSSQAAENRTEREAELITMVRRLTESPLVDSSQLMHQAEVISRLTIQRDFMIRQTEEERGRWASQRDGWDRMAEALIAQRNKSSTLLSKEEIERYLAAYESENKALRDKLNNATARLECLEKELAQLRPILMMEPVTTGTSISHYVSLPKGIPFPSVEKANEKAAEKLKPKKRTKKEPRAPVVPAPLSDELQDIPNREEIETQPTESTEKSTSSSSFFQFQAQPVIPPTTQPVFTGDHYRKPPTAPIGGPLTAPPTTLEFQVSTPTPPPAPQSSTPARTIRQSSHPGDNGASALATEPSTKKKRLGPPNPFASDARAEHLILAGRMIGHKRAAIVAGYVRNRTKELEMQKQERDRDRMAREIAREQIEKERQERIAERGAGGLSYYRRDVAEAGPSNGGIVSGSSPTTPKGGGNHYANADTRTSASPAPGPRVNMAYVQIEPVTDENSGRKGKGKGKAPQKSSSGKIPGTPHQTSGRPTSNSQSQSQGNPSTPLSSLIDAARMMGDDEGAKSTTTRSHARGRKGGAISSSAAHEEANFTGTPSTTGRRRAVAAVEQAETPPAPKRRRVASARAAAASTANNSSKNAIANEKTSGEDLTMTALHVLADAAYSSQGKGKAREMPAEGKTDTDHNEGDDVFAPSTSVVTPKRTRKAKAPPKEKDKKVTKVKPVTTTTTRKPRGKTASAATAIIAASAVPAAPRLISPPGPVPSPTPPIPQPNGTSTPSASTEERQLGPIPLEERGQLRGVMNDTNSELRAPVPLDVGDPSEDNRQVDESMAGPGLAPSVEIRDSRSPEPMAGIPQQVHKELELPLAATSTEEAGRPMDVNQVQIETPLPAAPPIRGPPTIASLLHHPEPASSTITTLLHSPLPPISIPSPPTVPIPPSSAGFDGGSRGLMENDEVDTDADAEGEVDAEGEIDLEESAEGGMILDSIGTAPATANASGGSHIWP